MPAAIVRSLAKKHGISIDKVESLWGKAKSIATKKMGKTDGEEYYAYVVGILKKMLKEECVFIRGEARLSALRERRERRRRGVELTRQAMRDRARWRGLRREGRMLRKSGENVNA